MAFSSPNTIKTAEFHRWASDLQHDIKRVLAENLSILLPSDRISLDQEPELEPAKFQVIVNIREFSGALGGIVKLNANWSVYERNPKRIFQQKTILQQHTMGSDYKAYVTAHSRLLESFSAVIADVIRNRETQETIEMYGK